jgi:hypothetical protein
MQKIFIVVINLSLDACDNKKLILNKLAPFVLNHPQVESVTTNNP